MDALRWHNCPSCVKCTLHSTSKHVRVHLVCFTPWLVQQAPCHDRVVILVQPTTQPVAAKYDLLYILLQCSGADSLVQRHHQSQATACPACCTTGMLFDMTRMPDPLQASHLVQVATCRIREEHGVPLRLVLQLVRVVVLHFHGCPSSGSAVHQLVSC